MNIEDRRREDRRRRFVRVNEERRHGEGRRKADEYHRRIRIIRECLFVRALGVSFGVLPTGPRSGWR